MPYSCTHMATVGFKGLRLTSGILHRTAPGLVHWNRAVHTSLPPGSEDPIIEPISYNYFDDQDTPTSRRQTGVPLMAYNRALQSAEHRALKKRNKR